jgi:hypothetical protein
MEYNGILTLNCRIEAIGNRRYRATTEGDGRGPQSIEFVRPFEEQAESEWLQQFQAPFTNPLTDRWRLLEEVGRKLFSAIFRNESLVTWRLLHRQAQAESRLLRVVLDIATPDLQPLPWEALYDIEENFFLARDLNTCLIRYPRESDNPPLPIPRRPLRILALAAAPRTLPRLDVAGERARLESTLQELVKKGEVILTWLDGEDEPMTLHRLTQTVQRAREAGTPFDIVHYIGHAGWSQQRSEGVLFLEDKQRQKEETGNVELGELLRAGEIRLAVLNACEGSRESVAAPFRSVAATLLRRSDIAAVVANQIPVSDEAAKTFAGAFYRTLAARQTVEEAVSAARREVAQSRTGNPEWVATIFYSRYRNQSVRIVPLPISGNPLLTATLLGAVLTIVGLTVVSVFRLHGPLIGSLLQAGVALVALWFALDRRDQLLRFRTYVISAIAIATTLILGWHFVYQPVLDIPTPPQTFALNIESPSPFIFADEQLTIVNLSVDVTGRVQNLPANHALWILVQEEGTATYTVGGRAFILEGGQFLVDDAIVGPAAFRMVGDVRYTIQPVLVNAEGDAFLQRQASDFWRFFHPDFRVIPEPRLQDALVIRR